MSNITGTISNIKKLSGDLSGTISSSVDLSGNIMHTILKGLSAYEVAVKDGFVGTEEEWLESLVGNGIDTVSIDSDGYLTLVFTKGSSYTTPISIKGKNGHSPYIGDNGNWYEYDDTQNGYVDTGYSSMTVLGDGLIKDSTTGRVSVDYPNALNLPSIENIPLRGNVTLSDLGIEGRLAGKVDKVDGKGLSTNNYTSNEKEKLANIESNAQVNVLEGIQKNGANVTITNKIANIAVPTNTNELINGAGFQTASDVATAIESALADITDSIPTPDWDESNSTSANYIANKPPIKTGTGTNSIIIGDSDNIASGICSIASGYQNISSNKYSIAFGEIAKASGQDSVAIGAFLNLGTITLTGGASSLTYTDTATNQSTVDLLKRYGQSLFVWVNNEPIRLTSITSNENLLITFTFESTLSEEAITAVDYTLYAANIATGVGAMAFGHANRASGQNAFVFGTSNASTGTASFVEGKANEASNNQSHAEGFSTKSTGKQSHSEGRYTIAAGERSHAQGEYTTANGYAETTIGRYNALSNSTAQTSYNVTNSPYILVAGNGTADNARSNAYTLDWSGNGWYAGKLTIGFNPVNSMDVTTKQYVDNLMNDMPQPEDDINVLNLLTEFGYSAPLSDADNKVVTDNDGNIILG